MGVATVQFFSESIGKRASYSVLLPRVGTGPYPVLIQLHGLSDDHHAWVQRSNLARYVENLPLVVILPDGGTSGYVNWKESGRLMRNRYEDMIMRDISDDVRRNFNVIDGKWAIGGLSMGGYGSMRLGLKYPDRFCSVWSHSSAFHIQDYLDPDLVDDESLRTASCFDLATQIAGSEDQPVLTFDCGVDDELIEHNRDLHRHMDSLGIAHTYNEHPGAHTWDYWDTHVQSALKQHCAIFGIEEMDPKSAREIRG